MGGLSYGDLEKIVNACIRGTATVDEQQVVAGLLKPCLLLLSDLPEHILQALMFGKAEELEILQLVLRTEHGILSMHDSQTESMH